ncbi:MAG: phosphatidylethanolamine-binding protein [Elusimicrobia bacterium RIFCSPLOWO2_02_FULL_39_32]|nr:MAG: phosphatidylethanolamine-binding protein [Elusimicrobia bacterium GWA2_38_7]OGR81223.1 MAG: phosphatidylethanolamine-binding protein [Elusimicrobia bacterium RIFCSPHIGHO2_02_FULL_39_36]OGR91775.1 MAG: phosphatidylethanolamine-binding protein [Elusimicrobia bacterium RIFCSPLOWO2_02_FULL_39_32]OGR98435.1 MAG: phosphatidylethanolamine-binding protein [Elusimicrobia bacterium RIFCSPLOWO2_12_FULL_39_28]
MIKKMVSTFLETIYFCSILQAFKNKGDKKMTLEIKSSAFNEGSMIPSKYTCDEEDISPPITWNEPPKGTKSFALISDDPDAPMGTWVHWVIYNIPSATRALKEDFPKEKELKDGTKQGITDFKRIGYGGPCPPSGIHRYYFKLYALDQILALQSEATKEDLLKAMKGHVLAESSLMGKYSRSK